MAQSFSRRKFFLASVILFFTIGGFVVPWESPVCSPFLIIFVFFLFPLVVISPILAFKLGRMCGRPLKKHAKHVVEPGRRTADDPQFYLAGGLGFVGCGVAALLHGILFRETIGVQFMAIGFGLAICFGVALYYRL